MIDEKARQGDAVFDAGFPAGLLSPHQAEVPKSEITSEERSEELTTPDPHQ
jgi:hypothetical protein